MSRHARKSLYLSPVELFRLDLACKPLAQIFDFPPYLVGSVGQRPDFRDVDVRLILKDKRYDRLVKAVGHQGVIFLGFAISAYLRDATGLPVDFQFQRMTEANELHGGGYRNSLGTRELSDERGRISWTGDATPLTYKPKENR